MRPNYLNESPDDMMSLSIVHDLNNEAAESDRLTAQFWKTLALSPVMTRAQVTRVASHSTKPDSTARRDRA